jgi:tetratricopeptide (TPR) repeat protein
MKGEIFHQNGRVNRNLLLTLVIVVSLLGAVLYFGHDYRTKNMAKESLIEGEKAMLNGDWTTAVVKYRTYLSRYPDDVGALKQYALARLSIRPVNSGNVISAIGAYRKIIQLSPQDPLPYTKLARLYMDTENYTELAYIAQRRLQFSPGDEEAELWLAKAYVSLHKIGDARNILVPLIMRIENTKGSDDIFTEACLIVGGIDSKSENQERRANANKWLDLAVQYQPNKVEPFLNRARYHLQTLYDNDQPLSVKIKGIRNDLDTAEKMNEINPKLRLALCNEWLKLNDLDKIEKQLEVLRSIDRKTIETCFTEYDDYQVAEYLVAAEVAARKDELKKGVTMTDQVLSKITEPGRRVMILPLAIKLYAADRRAMPARACLNEYLDILRITQQSPELSEEVVFLQAMVTWADNKPYKLINDLEPRVGRNPNLPRLWALLADAYLATDQTRRAAQAMEKYVTMIPDDYGRIFRLLQMYAQLEKWEKVLSIADKLREVHPEDDNREFMVLRARYALSLKSAEQIGREKELAEIENALIRLSEKYPNKVQIPLFQAEIKRSLNLQEQAREILYAALRCSDKLPVEIELVHLDLNENKYEKAIDLCRKLCDEYPDKIEPRIMLAESLEQAKQYPEARRILERAMSEFSSISDQKKIVQRLAGMAIAHNERNIAIQCLEDIAEKAKDDIDIRQYLVCQPEIYSHPLKSQKMIEEMQTTEGESGLRWRVSQAYLWMTNKDWRQYRDRIIENLNRCVDADQEWADPLVLLGQLYERLGDMTSAETFYHRAIANNSSLYEVWERLLVLYEHNNRMTDMRELLNKLPQNFPDRYIKRACFAARSGDIDIAIDELKRQISLDAKNIDAYLMLADLIFKKTHDPKEAFKILDIAEKNTDKYREFMSVRCDLLRKCGKNDEVRQLLNRAVEKYNDYDTILLRAKFMEDLGESAEVEKDYQRLQHYDTDGRSYEQLGQYYADHKRFTEALQAFEEGSVKFPNNMRLKRRMMKGLFLTGRKADKEKAIKLLNSMEKQFPNDADILYVRGLVFLDSGTPDSEINAKRMFEKAIDRDPSIIDAHLKLIAIAIKNKNMTKARELVISALAENPGNVPLMLTRAQIERLSGNYSSAYEMASLVVNDNPQNIAAIRIQIESAVESEDPARISKAEELVEKTMKAMPDNEEIRMIYVKLLQSQKRIKEAIRFIESYYSHENISKMSLPICLTLSELYRLDNNIALASELLHYADRISPMHSSIVRERIQLLASQHEYLSLVRYLGKYRHEKTCDPQIMILAASILADTRVEPYVRYAGEYLEEITKKYPNLIDAKLQYAWLMFQRKEYERSEQLYRDILVSEPVNVQAMNNLAWILAMVRNDYPSATEMINHAVDIMPENVDLRDTRADILMAAGQLSDARKDYIRCVQLSPPDSKMQARYLLKLARTTAKLGDLQQTQQTIEQAKSIDHRLQVFTEPEREELNELMRQNTK